MRALMLAVLAVASAAVAAEAPKLKLGDPAPPLATGAWVKGEPVTAFEKDKVYVVEFWATWCGPCRASIPHVSALQKQYPNVVFIGQNVWEEDEKLVAPFIQEMGDQMGYRVALDDKQGQPKGKMAVTWMEAAGQNGIPAAFVIDKAGNVAWIGHPMAMDKPLKQIVEGTYDLKREVAAMAIQERVEAALGAQQFEGALGVIDEALKADPTLEERFGLMRFRLLMHLKRWDDGVAQAARMYEPYQDDPMALNMVAWALVDPAAKPDKTDLDLAEKMAARAVELTKGENASILDTLARVYFDKGQVAKAVEFQTKAVAAEKDPEARAALQKTLDEYKAKAP